MTFEGIALGHVCKGRQDEEGGRSSMRPWSQATSGPIPGHREHQPHHRTVLLRGRPFVPAASVPYGPWATLGGWAGVPSLPRQGG